jgi:hypothetical protein
MKKAPCAQITGAAYCKNCEKMKMKIHQEHRKGGNPQPIEKRDKSTTYTIFKSVLDFVFTTYISTFQ